MIAQYAKFLINGGILGVLSIFLQAGLFRIIPLEANLAYAVATSLAYMPLLVLNFFIQRRWIFRHGGFFSKFLVANVAIMILVSLLAPLCRAGVASVLGENTGDLTGFPLAAILMSGPSFLLKRYYVFRGTKDVVR